MPFIGKNWNKALGYDDSDPIQLSMREEIVEQQTINVEAEQIKALARQDLDVLAALTLPDTFTLAFPPLHKGVWTLLRNSRDKRVEDPKIALGFPRGFAKTTVVKLFIEDCLIHSDVKFILIVCSTEAHAQNIIADIVTYLNSANIRSLYGDWTVGREIDRQNLKKFVFCGHQRIIVGMGAGGSLRGLNIGNARPDVMIFDDIQTKEDSESQAVSVALEKWMIGTAMKAKSNAGCQFIFIGNMYPGENSILRKLKNNPSWTKFISGAILADGSTIWPALRSKESLIAELQNDMRMGHPEIFFSEVLNDTDVGINTSVDLSLLAQWKWREHEIPDGRFIIIDPSANSSNKSDASVIGYYELYDGKIGLREIEELKVSPGNLIRRAILMALKNKVRLIAVESVAYQSTLLYWFEQICEQLDLNCFEFVGVHSGSHSKNSRITLMLRSLQGGDIVLHNDVKSKVIHQISNWNPLKRDNADGILDVLTYAPTVAKMDASGLLAIEHSGAMLAPEQGVSDYNSPF